MPGKKSKIESTQTPHMEVRVRSFGKTRLAKSSDAISSNIEDPFASAYSGSSGAGLNVLQPPYLLTQLAQMVEVSDTLGQCIEAMSTNIDGFGYEFVEAPHLKGLETVPEGVAQEKQMLESLFLYANPDTSFVDLRKKLRVDLESMGSAYMEIVRNRSGAVAEFYHIPSYTMRLTSPDKGATEYDQLIRDEKGKFEKVPRRKKFRRYVQNTNEGRKVYFKEFGDPRNISSLDGKEVGTTEYPATEVIYFKIYSSYNIYGLPRWIGQMLGMIGSRKAEEINYLYFDNKSIPPLVITVSGGSLTEEAIQKLEEMFEHEIKGSDNFHKALILEALPADVGEMPGEKITPVRIKVEPLTQFMQKDALFIEYRKEGRDSLRSSFRLPPIYTGRAEDYTRATAMESARVAEEQVFDPERRSFDYIINRTIMADLQINNWTFRSLGGKTSDDSDIVKAMSGVKEALPIGLINEAVADMRNVPVEELPDDIKGIPLALLSGFGNIDSPNNSGEEDEEDGEEQAEKMVKGLVKLREKLLKYIDKNGGNENA